MNIPSSFTFAQKRKCEKLFGIMKQLSKEPGGTFWADALRQYSLATKEHRCSMCRYLLRISENASEIGISTRTALLLSAYSD